MCSKVEVTSLGREPGTPGSQSSPLYELIDLDLGHISLYSSSLNCKMGLTTIAAWQAVCVCMSQVTCVRANAQCSAHDPDATTVTSLSTTSSPPCNHPPSDRGSNTLAHLWVHSHLSTFLRNNILPGNQHPVFSVLWLGGDTGTQFLLLLPE